MPLTEADIRSNYFLENEQNTTYIKEADKIDLPKTATSSVITAPAEEHLNVQKCDIRPAAKGILKYDEIIKNRNKFARAEEELYLQKLINKEYEFIKSQGNMNLLAAVYQTLIRKNYFNQNYFPGKKPIQPLHIRKFLNHRYNTDIDKQFRNFQNDKLLCEYLNKHPWITVLPSC
jgi:hypothetical protein